MSPIGNITVEVTFKDYVCGFIFNQSRHQIALIRKSKPQWQVGLYNGIGGKIEEGETAEQAIIREVEEEAGVHITGWKQFCEYYCKGSVEDREISRIHFFKVFIPNLSSLRSMTEERIQVFLTSKISQGFVPTIPNLKWLIPMALHKSYIQGIVVEQEE